MLGSWRDIFSPRRMTCLCVKKGNSEPPSSSTAPSQELSSSPRSISELAGTTASSTELSTKSRLPRGCVSAGLTAMLDLTRSASDQFHGEGEAAREVGAWRPWASLAGRRKAEGPCTKSLSYPPSPSRDNTCDTLTSQHTPQLVAQPHAR